MGGGDLVKYSISISDKPFPSRVNFGLVRRSYCYLNWAGSKCREAKDTPVFANGLRGGSAECKLRSGSGRFLTRGAIIFA